MRQTPGSWPPGLEEPSREAFPLGPYLGRLASPPKDLAVRPSREAFPLGPDLGRLASPPKDLAVRPFGTAKQLD